MTLIFGSLFAGIGGIDLGLERAGMKCVWQVEIDEYCQKVLKKHWPEIPRYGDVGKIKTLPYADLIAGGFPCQPLSQAGKRKGTEDKRWLWPEFIRIIRMVRPRYVLVENVPGLLNVNNGAAMSEVLGDLAEIGYHAEWDCVSARSVGAPHLRRRVFIVAHRNSENDRIYAFKGFQKGQNPDSWGTCEDVAYPGIKERTRLSGITREEISEIGGSSEGIFYTSNKGLPNRCRTQMEKQEEIEKSERSNSISERLSHVADQWNKDPAEEDPSTESFVGRVAHGVPDRVDRLKCLGNAVVPQVAEFIGRRIIEFDKNRKR